MTFVNLAQPSLYHRETQTLTRIKLTMKNNFLLLLALCFIGISNTFGQTIQERTSTTKDSGGQTALEKGASLAFLAPLGKLL